MFAMLEVRGDDRVLYLFRYVHGATAVSIRTAERAGSVLLALVFQNVSKPLILPIPRTIFFLTCLEARYQKSKSTEF